jgi:hypothetical protein
VPALKQEQKSGVVHRFNSTNRERAFWRKNGVPREWPSQPLPAAQWKESHLPEGSSHRCGAGPSVQRALPDSGGKSQPSFEFSSESLLKPSLCKIVQTWMESVASVELMEYRNQ